MKLYYFADGCSLATHIALREAGIEPELFRVDPATREIENAGGIFATVNPKGYVPALVFEDGSMLTENVALLDWTAQQAAHLKPRSEMERTRILECMAFVSTEIHKPFLAMFFLPGEEAKPLLAKAISGRIEHLAQTMTGEWLIGDRFTAADAFFYVMLRWAKASDLILPPVFASYIARVQERPSVKAALAAEGVAAV